MNLFAFFKKTYRVREITKGNNRTRFYPQRKFFFVWWPIRDATYSINGYVSCQTLDDAKKYLINLAEKSRRTEVIKKKDHKFDLVFEKLKQTND